MDYSHNVVQQISRPYASCVSAEQFSILLSPQCLVLTILAPVSMGSTVLDTIYKWNQEVFALL